MRVSMNQVAAAAGSMWERVVAKCPDHHLQPHLREARQVARDRGFEFNRIVFEDNHYGFFQDETPVAVIIKQDDHYDVHSNYQGKS